MTSWKIMMDEEFKDSGESWDDVVSNTMTPDEMSKEFDDGFGGIDGIPFTIWTKTRVYFPICYDGAESVGSVARDPDGHPTPHMGGGW